MQQHRQQHQPDSWINKPALRSPSTGLPICVKLPIAIAFEEKHIDSPIELKQRLQDLEIAYKETSQHNRENSEDRLSLVQRQTLHNLWLKLESIEWFKVFDLERFPIEKMRVNWLPQERCMELKISLSKRLEEELKEFKEMDFVGSLLMNKSIGAAYEGQLLLESLREGKEFAAANSEEKLMSTQYDDKEFTYRKYISVPKYICPRSLKVQFDLTRKILIIKSVVEVSEEKLEQRRELRVQQNKHNMVEAQTLLEKRFKHCCKGGRVDPARNAQQICKEHEDCHPKRLAVSFLDFVEMGLNNESIVPDFLLKHIVDEAQPELFYASHEIREFMRQQFCDSNNTLFNEIIRSPRFVQDKMSGSESGKDRKYRLRLECNLIPHLNREQDIHVKVLDEKRRIVLVEVSADIKDVNTKSSIAQQKMSFTFTVPEMVEMEGMIQEYCRQSGKFALLMTVNKQRSGHWFENVKKNQKH